LGTRAQSGALTSATAAATARPSVTSQMWVPCSAMAKHGTHICHVTDGPAAAAAVAVTVFTPVVVDINFSSGLRYFLDLSGTGGSYHGLGHCSAVDHLIERNRKRRAAGGCSGKGFQCDAAGVACFRLPYLGITFRRLQLTRPQS